MAEPSLGQALGLTVERRDIFAPAAKQLAVNLASFAEKKERKQKAREDQYNKFLDEIIGLRKASVHIREQANYDAAVNSLKKELDDKFNSGADQRSLAESFFKFYDKQSLIKKRSDMLLEDQKSAFQNPSIVNSRVAQKIYRTNQQLTANDLIEASAMGYDINPETGEILARRIQYTSIPETLKNIKFDKAEADDAVAFEKDMANKPPAEQAVYKGRKIPGFTQKVAEITRPSKVLYEMKVDNFLNSDRGYTESALQEIEQSLPANQSLASVIAKRQDELKTANNGVEPTLDLVKKSLAKDHFMNMYENWARENAVSDELQREPKGSSTSGKDDATVTQGRVVEQMQMTNDSYKRLGNVDYGQVLSTMGSERLSSENTPDVNNAVIKINKDQGFIASSPTIYFNTQASEPLTLSGGQSVNPLNMWYNKKDGSLYLLYDNKASAKGTSPSFRVNQVRVTKEEAASLLANTGTNIKATVEQWNLYAKEKGLPTLNDVADGRVSSTRTTTRTPSGGKSTTTTTSFNWSGAK
jgi:hypothetical protein